MKYNFEALLAFAEGSSYTARGLETRLLTDGEPMGNAATGMAIGVRREVLFAISLGLYFAWTSGLHYATLFGFFTQGQASLSSIASVSSAVLYAVVFLRCRRNLPAQFTGRNNAIFLVLGLCGIAMQSVAGLLVIAPVFTGLWIAWYRLGLVIYLVSLPRNVMVRCVGGAFLVCALVIFGLQLIPLEFVPATFCLILLVLFASLTSMKKLHDGAAVQVHRFVPFGSLWKIALFAFAFSFLFDVTETHLFFTQNEFIAYGIPLGFSGVSLVAFVISVILPAKSVSIDGQAFTFAVILACIGSIGFFISSVAAAPLAQSVVQITCGYSFVGLLIVLTAEISKRYSVQPCLLFSLVFCIQRVGNYLGELVGFGFMVDNPLSSEGMDALAGIAIVLCFAVVLIVFVSLNGKLTLYEKGLIGEGDDDERDSRLAEMGHVARAYMLTERETDVFFLMINRYSRKEMEKELFLSSNTIKTHVRNIYRKFEVHSQTELLEAVKGICSEQLIP